MLKIQIHCPRCQQPFQCKVDEIAHCDCQQLTLNFEQTQQLRQLSLNQYQGQCLCNTCIKSLIKTHFKDHDAAQS
ncbi:MAG: cysteine-rich CWC family protein [Flectobacillus sp.]|uniref:cysteine-rich CWC family protein n=1 Tax=Flectobacillus sp. TaxID=50419 RepID=UPI003B99C855